jgi:hypothetical protein
LFCPCDPKPPFSAALSLGKVARELAPFHCANALAFFIGYPFLANRKRKVNLAARLPKKTRPGRVFCRNTIQFILNCFSLIQAEQPCFFRRFAYKLPFFFFF